MHTLVEHGKEDASKRFDKLDMAMQHAAGELLDHLEAHDGRSA